MFFMLAICSVTFTNLCVDFYFLLLIVSAFCKRLSEMTMYMWLITLQKKLNIVALVFIYGSDFVFSWSFSIGIWIALTICHTK
jgi:hypothetical protein